MSFHFFNILMKNHDVFDAYQDRILISVFLFRGFAPVVSSLPLEVC